MLYECVDEPQQTFRWDAATGLIRVYTDVPGATPLCVDGGTFDPQAGSQVIVWNCHGGPQQQWEPAPDPEPDGPHHIRLRAYPERNLCLTVPEPRATLGVQLQLSPCQAQTGVPPQEWDLLAVRSRGPGPGFQSVYGTGRHFVLQSAVAQDRCLDVVGASRTPGAQMSIWYCVPDAQQTFHWDSATGLVRVYVDSGTALCLDGGAFDPQEGTRAIAWNCHGGLQQQWEPTADGRGLRLRGYPGRNLCLDVLGGATAPGSAVVLWTCSGSLNQQWTSAVVLYAIPMNGAQPTPVTFRTDLNGYGEVRFSVQSAPPGAVGRVCAYGFVAFDRNSPTFGGRVEEAHIHPSPPGRGSPIEIVDWNDGSPLVNGFNSVTGNARGAGRECRSVSRASANRLLDDPRGFYFNIHTPGNAVINGGVIRGQHDARPGPFGSLTYAGG